MLFNGHHTREHIELGPIQEIRQTQHARYGTDTPGRDPAQNHSGPIPPPSVPAHHPEHHPGDANTEQDHETEAQY